MWCIRRDLAQRNLDRDQFIARAVCLVNDDYEAPQIFEYKLIYKPYCQ